MTAPARPTSSIPDASDLARHPQLGVLASVHHQVLLLREVLTAAHTGEKPPPSNGLVEQGRSLLRVASTLEHQLLAYKALLLEAGEDQQGRPPKTRTQARS